VHAALLQLRLLGQGIDHKTWVNHSRTHGPYDS
jgi:hypothetical protein